MRHVVLSHDSEKVGPAVYLVLIHPPFHCNECAASLQVSFIQNLVYCVERAYRVPDYGMWERGSKYNSGSTELHSRCVRISAILYFSAFISQQSHFLNYTETFSS